MKEIINDRHELVLTLDSKLDSVEIRGKKYLFTDLRVDRKNLPKGTYVYEIRESDEGAEPAEISEYILVNFFGSIISNKPIENWDETFNGRHYIYFKFEDVPSYYYDSNNQYIETTEKVDDSYTPHYFPKESEFKFLDYDDMKTLKEYLKGEKDVS